MAIDKPPLNRNVPIKITIAAQYFLYFGVLGVFLPYFNLYCYHIGFSGFKIGVLSAVRSITLVIFSLVWSILADRYQVRRKIYIFCCFASTFLWSGFLFTIQYWEIFILTIVYGIFFSPIIAFMEAFTMDILGKAKKSYGKVRVWGTLAFVGTVISVGKTIDFYSIEIILYAILTGSLLHALFSTGIPHITLHRRLTISSGAKALMYPKTVIFLICAFLMLVSHGAYYGFFSIHLEKLGFDKTFIGLAWALASISEIAVMLNSNKIFERFSMEKVLIFSMIIAMIRWTVLAFATSAPAILLSQLMHAGTYGAFHIASILYIDSVLPEETKTLGQSVNNAMTYGLGMMAGFFLSGYLFEKTSTDWLFIAGSITAALGAFLMAFTFRNSLRKPPETK